MVDGKNILDLIISRQSDRKYSDKPIEKVILERIVEAGRWRLLHAMRNPGNSLL